MQKVLSVAVVAVLIAGVVAALSHTSGDRSSSTGRSRAGAAGSGVPGPATTTSAAPVTSTPPTSGAPSSTAASATHAASTTTAVPPPSAHPLPTVSGASGDPGQPTATAPGTYRYDVSYSNGQSGSSSGTMTEKVTTQASSGGVTRQSVAETQSVNPPPANGQSGQGSGTEVVQWGAQGLEQLSVQMDAGGQSIDCTWSPPVLELPSGLVVGRRWTFDSTCHVTLFGQPGTVQLSGSASVTGKQVVKVGADQVAVWVVSDTYTLVVHSDRLAATFTIHHNATDRVSGRLGLLVEEDATDSMGSNTTVSHQELQSIHPS